MTEGLYVIHLVSASLGVAPLERFLESSRRHPAGIEYRLLVVFNGFREDERAPFEAALAGVDFEPLYFSERRVDLAAYRTAAETVKGSVLFLANSNSEVLAAGWLATMERHFSSPGIGLVGTTASYEQSAASPLGRAVGRGRLMPFPNPHIRTNAFMISRELMLDLEWGEVRKKAAAWQLENGPQSITRQVLERGLEALVVGRDGEAYPQERWYQSLTFRSGDQENLLVADNRTREYWEADPATQRWLAELAWGRDAVGTGGRERALDLRVRGRRALARYGRKTRS